MFTPRGMQRFLRSMGFTATVLGLLIGSAGSAGAGITLTLEDPDPTVVRPSVGTTTIDFPGMITPTAPSLTPTELLLDRPNLGLIQLGGSTLNATTIDDDIAVGKTFTGPLFEVNITSTDPPGLYTGGTYAVVTEIGSAEQPYTVNLVGPSVVPEPSTLTLWVAAGGIIAGVAYGVPADAANRVGRSPRGTRRGTRNRLTRSNARTTNLDPTPQKRAPRPALTAPNVGPDADQVHTSLIKPGHTFHATLHRTRGDLQPREVNR